MSNWTENSTQNLRHKKQLSHKQVMPLHAPSHLQYAALNEAVSEAEGRRGEHIRYRRVQWLVIQPSAAAISRTQLELLHIVATYKKKKTRVSLALYPV
jgi:hypothetical protein